MFAKTQVAREATIKNSTPAPKPTAKPEATVLKFTQQQQRPRTEHGQGGGSDI